MANAITTLQSLSAGVSSGTFTSPAYQVTAIDQTNPVFPRLLQLTDAGLIIRSTGTNVGIPLVELTKMAAKIFPALTWPPIITSQPSSGSVFHPNPYSFSVAATDEYSPINYLWQLSTNGGSSFSSLSNGGVYANISTTTLNISNSTGLGGNVYRCVTWNLSGTTTSKQATLTVG